MIPKCWRQAQRPTRQSAPGDPASAQSDCAFGQGTRCHAPENAHRDRPSIGHSRRSTGLEPRQEQQQARRPERSETRHLQKRKSAWFNPPDWLRNRDCRSANDTSLNAPVMIQKGFRRLSSTAGHWLFSLSLAPDALISADRATPQARFHPPTGSTPAPSQRAPRPRPSHARGRSGRKTRSPASS